MYLFSWGQCFALRRRISGAVHLKNYWPDSEEAISAKFFIGEAYRDMGEDRKGKKTLEELEQYSIKKQIIN